MARQPPLDRDEELSLVRRAEAGDEAALARLVFSHLRFVVRIARGYRGWGLPMSDLVQEGLVGLIHAVRRFRPECGVRLSTYARWWIRQAIQDQALRSFSVVRLGTSNGQRMLALKLKSLRAQLCLGDGWPGDETLGRLAQRFGTTIAEARRLAVRMLEGDGSTDGVASELPDPEQEVARRLELRRLRAGLIAALAALPPRERLVIHRRYVEEATASFAAIGRELGVSKERARQLEARALAKLRAVLAVVLTPAEPASP